MGQPLPAADVLCCRGAGEHWLSAFSNDPAFAEVSFAVDGGAPP
ncbi:hypothetical protein SCATT_p17250 (plasmid) [Streptantibioticus cattleyicolor NRRL 8057 = DSM 46488]|uniref:Uncharacterized protein n=1 Tax=Streptantibioticus cattleyicolor (strain ATCC 35852 / DSM 46488 / JCM 4925 / NBRC 14057 / NRRL 8057) TaxID=1003195 RepID=G8XI12_STREN|nr:hypothetical protein SCATT_p17250 [Streptantibioticus cattleyicolor NRRL 8057 = DSM 46488]